MVALGVTNKSAPLALLPIEVPPLAAVNQLIVLEVDVAFKFVVEPLNTVEGVAVTELATVGNSVTVTVVEILLVHPPPLV